MIMVNFDFLSKPICLADNKIQVLCIESQKLFRTILRSFFNDETEEKNIIFSEDFTPFKARGNVCVIENFFDLSYSNIIIKRLYEQIQEYCNNEQLKETIELKTHLINYMEVVVGDFDFDFDFNYDINLVEIFKAVNLKPHIDRSDLIGALLDYILLVNRYIPAKCFIIPNLHLYFIEEEIALFYKDIINNHINVLIIENTKFFLRNENESIIILDEDFCEIVDSI